MTEIIEYNKNGEWGWILRDNIFGPVEVHTIIHGDEMLALATAFGDEQSVFEQTELQLWDIHDLLIISEKRMAM